MQETGHRTKGHLSLTEDDRETAKSTRCSLLYGELLPRGVNKVRQTHDVCFVTDIGVIKRSLKCTFCQGAV